ncbi:hypothetical protein QYM36_006427 [Artemia franciscana]|uniref:Reverse transcriptase domain-containing protein n=1 Tax=Artemia franciscana TaxID=6661 RepID=A0AA88HYP4_ARTSF|nr:hypothetical protein QYM36_006427 [Artemia franciscana]
MEVQKQSLESRELQILIDLMAEYLESKKRRLNLGKTEIMIFNKGGRRNLVENEKFRFKGQEIKVVEKAKYLGFTLTPNCSLKEHVSEMSKRGKAAGKLNPVDVLSRPPNNTPLQTRAFSLADKEVVFCCSDSTDRITDNEFNFAERKFGLSSHITVSPQDHDSLGEAASLQDQPNYIDTSERNENLNDMKGNESIFIDPQMNPGKLDKLLEKWNIVPWLQKEVDRLILWERILYRMPPPEEDRKSNAQILQLMIPRKSPRLFGIFVHDIIELLEKRWAPIVKVANKTISALLFADNMEIVAKTARELQILIDLMAEYLESKKLRLNLGKTEIMIFNKGGRRNSVENERFRFEGQENKVVEKAKYLGFILKPNCS